MQQVYVVKTRKGSTICPTSEIVCWLPVFIKLYVIRTEYVHRMSLYHLHFRIEFLIFWYLSLRVPVYLGRKGESVFYDLEYFLACATSFIYYRFVSTRLYVFKRNIQIHTYQLIHDKS